MQSAKAAGLNEAVIQDLLAKLGDKNIKEKLKERTDEALAHGVREELVWVHYGFVYCGYIMFSNISTHFSFSFILLLQGIITKIICL